MKKPVIGILTWREGIKFEEPSYLHKLIGEGNKQGATIFVFSPQDIAFNQKNEITGFITSKNGDWIQASFPWPDIVIDRYRRYRKSISEVEAYFSLRQQETLRFANNYIDNKLNVNHVLESEKRMRKWIPKTCRYSPKGLCKMLSRFPMLYMKPGDSTGGRGVLRIERIPQGYNLLGRNKQRVIHHDRVATIDALLHWIDKWVDQEMFIIQRGLRLELVTNRVVDMRLLIQKNGAGKWKVTGYGMRVGGEQSPTSNLHGGGVGHSVDHLLLPRFGTEKYHSIMDECHDLAYLTATTIENHYGKMIELGIDIGIDIEGNVWFIEVNSMPDRKIFMEIGRHDLYETAIRLPLQYSLFLANHGME